MKKLCILIISLLLLPIIVLASSTDEAKEPIDTTKKTSLSLTYKYDDISIDNVTVKAYKIANISKDFRYTLTNDFTKYSIELNGIDTTSEWNNICNTLVSYIYADLIKETTSGIITNNVISFDNLETGLYLFITDKIDEDTYILEFDPFLMNLPMLNESKTWDYDVKAEPKPSYYEPKYQDITYKVIKEWKDNSSNSRPNEVNIEIYHDGKLVESQILSSRNNWSYSWTTIDDGSIWTIVEREVPSEYTVSINKNDKTFIVVNTKKEENPKTADNIYMYLILLLSSFVGLVLMIFNIKQSKED